MIQTTMTFEFTATVFPYMTKDKCLEKEHSSRIEVSHDLVNKFPFEIFSDLTVFRVFVQNDTNEVDEPFLVSFGGIGDLPSDAIRMPRWCIKKLGIRPITQLRFQHVPHVEQVNFIRLFPASIDFKRSMPDEEQRFAFLQSKMKNYLVIHSNTQIELYDTLTDTRHQFLIGDMFNTNGKQILNGRTLDCDVTIDLQFPTDPEEEKRLRIEAKQRKRGEEYQHALYVYNIFKAGKLLGYSTVPKHPDVCLPQHTIIEGTLI
jgi:hypothetical protein